MGNKQQQAAPLLEQIASFDPLIFPQAQQETEALRKKLHIGRNFKKLQNPEDIPEKLQQFLSAASLGSSETVHQMLKEDETLLNATNSKLRTALHVAAMKGHFDLVASLLLLPDISLNVQDLNGRTPLLLCCYFGFPDKGCKLDVKTAPSRNGTDYHLKMKAIILLLIGDPRTDLDLRDFWKRTALMYCANAGLFPQLSAMIERGANINLQDSHGATAMHYASKVGEINSIRVLIESGAALEIPDINGMRPIHFAAAQNHLDVCRLLKSRKVSVDEKNSAGMIPAQLSQSLDVIWFLEDRFTCDTHPFQIDFCDKYEPISIFGEARVGMSMCPGRSKKNWRRHLDRDIKEIQNQKIQTVVTLVQMEELVSMGIPNLFDELTKAGIQSVRFPIHDKWIPSEMADFIACVTRVVAEIQLGRTLLVHCNGGKGRTGLVVVAAMMSLGMEQDEAIRIIREARPGMIANPAQILYLHAYNKYCADQEEQAKQARAAQAQTK